MDKNRGNKMTVKLVSNEKVAETSSKGNQEKWFDKETNKWYKLDQFGYEALAETLISRLLEKSNISSDTPFSFAKYQMERLNVHGRDRTGCSSESFLKSGQSIITLSHLFSRQLGISLKDKLMKTELPRTSCKLPKSQAFDDTQAVLLSLGYEENEIEDVLEKIMPTIQDHSNSEEVIRKALTCLSM